MEFREITARLVAPILRCLGYRFDKAWRRADRGLKVFVY